MGGSLNHKWGRNRDSTWRIIDLFEFVVLEEWFIGVCDAGIRHFNLRLGQVRGIAQAVYWVIRLVVNAVLIISLFIHHSTEVLQKSML